MLSDYRVIVLGVSQSSVTPGLRRRLEGIEGAGTRKLAPTTTWPASSASRVTVSGAAAESPPQELVDQRPHERALRIVRCAAVAAFDVLVVGHVVP